MPATTKRKKPVHKQKTAVPAAARQLPNGLIRAVAKVIDGGQSTTEQKGILYYFVKATTTAPAEHSGITFDKLWFLKATAYKSAKDRWDDLLSDLQLLGQEVNGITEKHITGILASLKDQNIYFEFNTWRPAPDKKNPNPRTFPFIQGVCDAPEA